MIGNISCLIPDFFIFHRPKRIFDDIDNFICLSNLLVKFLIHTMSRTVQTRAMSFWADDTIWWILISLENCVYASVCLRKFCTLEETVLPEYVK